MEECWPNFFIAGAPKAGTTSLYWYLRNIPGIYMPSIKEPNYFSITTMPKHHSLRPIRDKRKYLNLFKDVTDEKIIVDASPHYLADPEAPHLIHQVVPHACILISLRDPVELIFSSYLKKIGVGVLHMSLNDEIQNALHKKIDPRKSSLNLEDGMYSENVKRYFDIFGREQVKVIIFEEFIKDAKGTVEEILRFLGISQKLDNFDAEAHNPFSIARGPIARYILSHRSTGFIAKKVFSTSVREILKDKVLSKKSPKPKMEPQDRETLIRFYSEDVKKIEDTLGRKLPWPNFKN